MNQTEKTRRILEREGLTSKPKRPVGDGPHWGWIALLAIAVLLIESQRGAKRPDKNPVTTYSRSAERPLSQRDRPYNSDYTAAAQRAGYSGSEAEQVGAAAESICLNTGKC